jgi:hypothetical protein
VVFGRQTDVRPGIVPFGGLAYREFMEIIPYVQKTAASSEGPLPSLRGVPPVTQFSYMPYILVDRMAPLLIGRNIYGLNKQLAHIYADEGSYYLGSKVGDIGAAFVPTAPPKAFSDSGIDDLGTMIQLPSVGQLLDGSFVYSSVHFDLGTASAQPMTATVNIDQPFVPAGLSETNLFQTTFRIVSRWEISVPLLAPKADTSPIPEPTRAFSTAYARSIIGRRPLR